MEYRVDVNNTVDPGEKVKDSKKTLYTLEANIVWKNCIAPKKIKSGPIPYCLITACIMIIINATTKVSAIKRKKGSKYITYYKSQIYIFSLIFPFLIV